MLNVERLFVSDLHMGATDSVEPAGGRKRYGWLSPAHAQRLGEFLTSRTVTRCQQLLVVGDAIDLQICPHDVQPPTAQDVLQAPHNRPIVDGIMAFAKLPGRTVTVLSGDHDLGLIAQDLQPLGGNVNCVPRYDEYPLRVRHGHEDCLFNAPDPMGRPFPLGYFISRFVATAAARGLAPVGLNLQLIWDSGKQLVDLLNAHPLAECVFDAICHAADINLGDTIAMPGGGTIGVGAVRAMYQNLVAEWAEHRGNPMEAVLAEWEPFYPLPVGKPYLNIVGHSHDHKYSSLVTGGVYMNLGSWCDGEAYFARTWVDDPGEPGEALRAQLFHWVPGIGAQATSTCAHFALH